IQSTSAIRRLGDKETRRQGDHKVSGNLPAVSNGTQDPPGTGAATVSPSPRLLVSLSPSPWLAAVAIVPILATVYQTLVLTDVTDDVIRKGIDGEHYQMIWTNVCWGITVVYGLFGGIWAMARF